MLSLILTNSGGAAEVMPLIRQVTWSGDYRQGARKLSFDLLSSPYDQSVNPPEVAPGTAVSFFQDERLLFSGLTVGREKATGSATVTVSCYDKGFYLLKNQGVYQFKSQPPDAIARRVCGDFVIPVGELAAAGGSITRNFIGVSLYRIIMTGYTLASYQDGKAYQLRFIGDKLHVTEIKENDETLILEGGVNLQSASASDSIENTVTQVVVYNAENQAVQTVKNSEIIPLYGVIQQALRQKDGEDAGAQAQRLLDSKGLSQAITVEALGNIACVTGGTVVVREPYTGLYGLFWITSDKHVWKDGQYYCQLSLSYKRLMDAQEAGSLPNKTGKKTVGKAQSKTEKTHFNMSPYNNAVNSQRVQQQ